MPRSRFLIAVVAAGALGAPIAAAQRSLVVYCSHAADACELAARTFQREGGIATTITRKEIELSSPVTSGTGYTILATLVVLHGEDATFAYLKRLAPNVVRYTQSGTAQGPSVARGEVAVGVSFAHEFVTQQLAGFAVDIAIPCEGAGAALGGMAILAGAPHPAEARIFYDWALTRSAQELANSARNLILPANAMATIRPEAARFADVAMLDVDPAKFGQPEERRRLLARWQREIGDALR